MPSYERVSTDKLAFAEMTKISHNETNPFNAKRLVQYHDRESIVANPPAFPLSTEEMDHVYGLSFTHKPHPHYGNQQIPAYEVVKDSVQIMRGCFGGCTFCSITAHEGRIIQSRSQQSIVDEVRQMTADPQFKGVVSDIGGPTANMYQMRCTRPEVEAKCRRLSCVHPTICKLLGTDHAPLVQLMRTVREEPGVKKVLVASGIRMDLARRSPEYMRELTAHHVGGHLKVAPEHTDPGVLALMKKPTVEDFQAFDREFKAASKQAGKKQYLVPYFIASHPGSTLDGMIDLALFLKRNHYEPDQVQDFIPSPFDIAACIYHTGMDPFTKKPVAIARHLRDRKLQRALMQFFKPENYFDVRRALEQAGRQDLIGAGCDCLIPERPPRQAIDRRRRQANREIGEQTSGDHIRSKPGGGYRPQRKLAAKREARSLIPRRCIDSHPTRTNCSISEPAAGWSDWAGTRSIGHARPPLEHCAAIHGPGPRPMPDMSGLAPVHAARLSRRGAIAEPWQVRCAGGLAFESKPTPFGHVGLFPEQAEHWYWIAEQGATGAPAIEGLEPVCPHRRQHAGFGGGGLLGRGTWTRPPTRAGPGRNAEASSLSQAPVRWITEDAGPFFAWGEPEAGAAVRRDHSDPPTYGHGPHTEVWKIDEHLDQLWTIVLELLSENWQFVLLTVIPRIFLLQLYNRDTQLGDRRVARSRRCRRRASGVACRRGWIAEQCWRW